MLAQMYVVIQLFIDTIKEKAVTRHMGTPTTHVAELAHYSDTKIYVYSRRYTTTDIIRYSYFELLVSC